MSAIRTKALAKDYFIGFWRKRPRRALDGLSLAIDRGEIFGLLGPNGAGKTTTLKLLMQLIFPTAGRAEILGRPVGDVSVRRHIGYLPENPYFYDNLTTEELLSYFAGLFGSRGSERRGRINRLLDRVGLGSERRLHLRRLSKGQLQRVGIAQALLNDPEVVLLDEPMSGLDPIGRRDVRQLILELRDEGRTVLFSSHILSDAEALCNRVGVLVGGRLVACDHLSNILTLESSQGWELVVAGLADGVVERLGSVVRRATRVAEGHYAIELGPDRPPEAVLQDVIAAGGHLLSLTPLRHTLEDFFVEHVARVERQEPPG